MSSRYGTVHIPAGFEFDLTRASDPVCEQFAEQADAGFLRLRGHPPTCDSRTTPPAWASVRSAHLVPLHRLA